MTDEWIKKLWYTHIMEYSVQFSSVGILLTHKKECIAISSNEMDETGAYYTERSKSERER